MVDGRGTSGARDATSSMVMSAGQRFCDQESATLNTATPTGQARRRRHLNTQERAAQIHVKGTLTEPKVSATAVNTLTTTVDEVLRGDAEKK